MLGLWLGVSGLGLRASALRFKVHGVGVWGSGFRVEGGVQGFAFWVWSLR